MTEYLFSGFTSNSQEVYYYKVLEKTFKLVVDQLLHMLKTRD
jgi:hypothetical protein